MYSDHFWLCLEGLSLALDGNPQDAGDSLTQYEKTWLKWSEARRGEIRAQLADAIGALARLETRLAGHYDSHDRD